MFVYHVISSMVYWKCFSRSHVCREQLQVRLQGRSQTSRCSQKEHANRNNAVARPKTRCKGPEPLRFLIWSLFGQRVLFNGEGGNRARTRQPMADRLEIIHGIAGRAAASESGGEVRLDEVYARSPRLLNIRRACPGTALLSQEVGLPLFDRR